MAKAEEEARQGQGQAPTEQSARSQSGHDHSHVHGHGHGHGPTHAYGHHGHPTARGGLLHQHAPVRPPDSDGDIVMDALTASMAGLESSLSFVPRNVARRARQRETRG